MIILAITLFFVLLSIILLIYDILNPDLIIIFLAISLGALFIEYTAVLTNDPMPLSSEYYNTVEEEYYALMDYKQIIEETDNEFIRYDFYQKIEKWNDQYYTYQRNPKNPLINIFYDFKSYKNCQPIEFNLKHTDSP